MAHHIGIRKITDDIVMFLLNDSVPLSFGPSIPERSFQVLNHKSPLLEKGPQYDPPFKGFSLPPVKEDR